MLVGQFEINNASATKFEVTYYLTNHGGDTKHICKYFTPLERVCARKHIQIVDCVTGQALPYRGIMCERVAPSVSNGSYISIAPKDCVHFKHTIDFVVVQPGKKYQLVTPNTFTYIHTFF